MYLLLPFQELTRRIVLTSSTFPTHTSLIPGSLFFPCSASYFLWCFPRCFRQFPSLYSSNPSFAWKSVLCVKSLVSSFSTTFLFCFMCCRVVACLWGKEGDWILGLQFSFGSSFSQRNIHTYLPWNQLSQSASLSSRTRASLLEYSRSARVEGLLKEPLCPLFAFSRSTQIYSAINVLKVAIIVTCCSFSLIAL